MKFYSKISESEVRDITLGIMTQNYNLTLTTVMRLLQREYDTAASLGHPYSGEAVQRLSPGQQNALAVLAEIIVSR